MSKASLQQVDLMRYFHMSGRILQSPGSHELRVIRYETVYTAGQNPTVQRLCRDLAPPTPLNIFFMNFRIHPPQCRFKTPIARSILFWAIASGLSLLVVVFDGSSLAVAEESLVEMMQADGPVAWWRFEEAKSGAITNEIDANSLSGKPIGAVRQAIKGPAGKAYPLFDASNRAAGWSSQGYFRISDPGNDSVLDFQQGDAITIEAWVNPTRLANDRQSYIVGKGRTFRNGQRLENQNYALRLRGIADTARLSFLFRDKDGEKSEYHRWNSNQGPEIDGNWHHVAVSYVFGEPKSIRGYIDGKAVEGFWDLGGATTLPPVVDNDEVWIGSSMGGNPGSTFEGGIDEVAIYRSVIDLKRLQARYAFKKEFARSPIEAPAELTGTDVVVEIFENFLEPSIVEPTETYKQPHAAFLAVPQKYDTRGLRTDRSNPFLVRAWSKFTVNEESQLIMRAKGAARLYLNGKKVAENPPMSRNASGHEKVPKLIEGDGLIPPPAPEHRDKTVTLKPGEYVARWELTVGGKGMRAEIGQPLLAIGDGDEFVFVHGQDHEAIPFTDDGWRQFSHQQRQQITAMNDALRRSPATEDYWRKRHQYARRAIKSSERIQPPEATAGYPAYNAVDHFINRTLAAKEIEPSELTDDFAFYRRVALDATGALPTPADIQQFESDSAENRREKVINQLLNDPGWADNWVGYWQDVLAENPGILKPKLNNTGPFRYWIHESFRDNKSIDRLATELVMMEGSKYGGGAGGFAMATQNDSPYAAKAHVLGAAFLGVELKCARCHDAPFHSHMQEDLFNMAAMLNRQPITLPKTSTVPTLPGGREPAIEITLKPGQKIAPHFPFEELVEKSVPDSLLNKPSDSREQLAAAITSPHNDRFAEVIVNRLWSRYMGVGFVEPVHDWEDAEIAHADLLRYLADELVLHNYDLKHVARLIFNSHAYQRQSKHHASLSEAQLFAAPSRRRMSAEQLLDSLYLASEKPLRSEQLTLDPEGRRSVNTFMNLGSPTRAWQFTSLSNERDRPALALPVAQSFVDFLSTFGWRDARPDPLTVRDDAPNVLQPLQMANGMSINRIAQLSDDSVLTEICLKEQPLPEMIEAIHLRLLSRRPTEGETALFVELLQPGYEKRIIAGAKIPGDHGGARRTAVSWANHLNAEATRIKLQLEEAARWGDVPTQRLREDWRERAEDMIWALINSPEYVFIP